jgi:uncharacterized protein (TIGR03000 family)
MRKVLLIIAVAALTLTVTAGDVFAQRRGGGSRGNGGYRGNSVYRGNGGYRGYDGYRNGNGTAFYFGGLGLYGGNLYGRGSYGAPYVYDSNYYYDADPIVQVPATEIRQSFYSEPANNQQIATMVVLVPRTDAKVWVDGAATNQQGMERSFNSPPLQPGNYVYTIRARWLENGQAVERDRRVNVQPGQSVTVNFRVDSGEFLQKLPLSK